MPEDCINKELYNIFKSFKYTLLGNPNTDFLYMLDASKCRI